VQLIAVKSTSYIAHEQ